MLQAPIDSMVSSCASSTPQHAPTKRNCSITTQELPAYWHFHWHCGGGSLALSMRLKPRRNQMLPPASSGYRPCGATITFTANSWAFEETSLSNATGFLQK